MALVLLVVVGHSWTLLPDTGFNDTVYDALYAWHVPAFVFVTGYLSRSFRWERARMSQLVRTVVVPYVIFETLLALFRILVGGETLEDLFLDLLELVGVVLVIVDQVRIDVGQRRRDGPGEDLFAVHV